MGVCDRRYVFSSDGFLVPPDLTAPTSWGRRREAMLNFAAAVVSTRKSVLSAMDLDGSSSHYGPVKELSA